MQTIHNKRKCTNVKSQTYRSFKGRIIALTNVQNRSRDHYLAWQEVPIIVSTRHAFQGLVRLLIICLGHMKPVCKPCCSFIRSIPN